MEVRLQKFLAECGVASRRKCEEIILDRKVKVNGKIVSELGTKVDPEKDIVEVNGQVLTNEKKVYILLNKPVGYVTTMSDEKERPTVMELLDGVKEKVVPVGRLDMFTSGLLLLSNDGEFIYKVTHPKHETTKTYIVKTRGVPKESDLEKLRRGVKIETYTTSPAKVELLLKDNVNDIARIWIQIHEGRNRQVRKMCEAIGLSVIALKREGVGNLNCEGVERGKWRYLTDDEVKDIMENNNY
ncbi:MAG: rRNA pseudouridine synthase [Clostridia bacterium]|nr:rRNA pseudouridine synthase [Clostridia bacterium]